MWRYCKGSTFSKEYFGTVRAVVTLTSEKQSWDSFGDLIHTSLIFIKNEMADVMLGHLWRQNIYLASATLEKSPSLSWVLSVEVLEGMPWGGAVGQSWRAAAVLIFDLACKHSHSRLARGAGCCCLPCQHTGADIFPIGSFSAVRVIFPLACFLFYLLSPDLPN